MPLYKYGDKFYKLDETDPDKAIQEIQAHLGESSKKNTFMEQVGIGLESATAQNTMARGVAESKTNPANSLLEAITQAKR